MDGTELVVGAAAATRRTALTTLRAAAVFAGVTPGAPAPVYQPATPLDPDEPPPGDPAFWNAPFGAARTFRQVGIVAEAAAFFRDGRARALAAAAAILIRRTS